MTQICLYLIFYVTHFLSFACLLWEKIAFSLACAHALQVFVASRHLTGHLVQKATWNLDFLFGLFTYMASTSLLWLIPLDKTHCTWPGFLSSSPHLTPLRLLSLSFLVYGPPGPSVFSFLGCGLCSPVSALLGLMSPLAIIAVILWAVGSLALVPLLVGYESLIPVLHLQGCYLPLATIKSLPSGRTKDSHVPLGCHWDLL